MGSSSKRKFDLLEKVKASSAVDIHCIRQKEPLGPGHTIWCARNFIGDYQTGIIKEVAGVDRRTARPS